MAKLSQEMKAYECMRLQLEADYFGKWVVFHDEKPAGLYDTFEAAADDAVKKFGRGPYLIRQIGEAPITHFASAIHNPDSIHV